MKRPETRAQAMDILERFQSGVLGSRVSRRTLLLGTGVGLMSGLLAGASTSRASQLLYAPFVPLFVVLLRGDIPLSLGLALYIYGPLIVAVVLGRVDSRPARVRAMGRRSPMPRPLS